MDALRAELAGLKTQVAEGQRATQYWQERASKGAEPAKPKDETEDDTDLLELITTKGVKGLDELMAKRGYTRKADVDAVVNERTNRVVAETRLMERFPELKKQDSEFFKTTAGHYGELRKQGVSEAVAMEMAAERTELAFLREGKIETSKAKAEREKAEKEADRKARIAAQSGDRGVRGAAPADDEDDELTDEQKRMASAFGISEEAYKARAKAGVAMKGTK